MNQCIFEINASNTGSTGGIMLQVADIIKRQGFEVVVCCPDSRTNRPKKTEDTYFIGNRFSRNLHLAFRKFFGLAGFLSIFPTLKLIKKMKQHECKLVHLHNIHGDYLNYPLLFHFIKKKNIPVIWTLHDCWTFTGRCPYFDLVKCQQWQHGCKKCPYPKTLYPEAKIDMTRFMWACKKKWFTGIERCVVVTPSHWLADLAKKSFLGDYPVSVIHNGIDLDIFKPRQSCFRKTYQLEDKKIVLGVAFGWGYRKGLDVFIELSKRLPDDYKIVLVGTDSNVAKSIPNNILSINRTQNRIELAEIYSAANVFVNPTREENYPTVNMESIACGTPVITFKTGGSPEIPDKNSGVVVPCDNINLLEKEIYHICENQPNMQDLCIERAKSFDNKARFNEYIKLYCNMLES